MEKTMDMGFCFDESWVGRTAVVSVSGDLDALTAPAFADAIQAAAGQEPEALIADLSNVAFLASAAMSVLVTAQEDLRASMRFGVVADGPATSRPLSLLGIDALVPVYRTLGDALGDIRDRP
jgi:anti-sigma B factor antagonist